MRPSFSALPLLFLLALVVRHPPFPKGFYGSVKDAAAKCANAVAAHRAAQREEQRRGEAIAGRRLTAGECSNCGSQVRGAVGARGNGCPFEFGRITACRAHRAGTAARRQSANRAAQPAPLKKTAQARAFPRIHQGEICLEDCSIDRGLRPR